MALPKVNIAFTNGNLLQDVAAVDGIAGIVCTGTGEVDLYTPLTVYSLADAENQGITAEAEPSAHRHIKEFYAEVAGNQLLYVLLLANTVTMAEALNNSNATGAKLLTSFAGGTIRLLGVCHSPAGGYDGGEDYMDADVAAAVTAAGTFGAARLAELAPLRVLVEGRVMLANETSPTIYHPTAGSINYAGVVLGGSLNDGSASVGTALGRLVSYPAEIKMGKVANGPLQLASCFIGTKTLAQLTNLDALHGYGYISFMQYANKAGYYFGIDRMANTTDYRLLAYCRVVDKCAVIAAQVYTNQLESEVDLTPAGKITPLAARHLQDTIESQVNNLMGDQISSFTTSIDLTQDVLNTSTLTIKLGITPKGYTSVINIDLGLASPTA